MVHKLPIINLSWSSSIRINLLRNNTITLTMFIRSYLCLVLNLVSFEAIDFSTNMNKNASKSSNYGKYPEKVTNCSTQNFKTYLGGRKVLIAQQRMHTTSLLTYNIKMRLNTLTVCLKLICIFFNASIIDSLLMR